MNVTPLRRIDCEAFEQQLPWYCNGTLDAAARAALDQHGAQCARCRQSLALEQRVVAGMRRDVAHSPREDRIETTRWRELEARLPSRAPSGRRWLYGVIAAQAAAIAVLAVALVWQSQRQVVADYRTVSSADSTLAHRGAVLRVTLGPAAIEKAQSIFTRSGVRAIGAPTAAGVFAVTPLSGSATAPATARDALRQEPGVQFAEIVSSMPEAP
jgi:Putative zinc-finger